MALSQRRLSEVVSRALQDHPGAEFQIEVRKHYRISITIAGQSRLIFTPQTPSDKRGEMNLITLIKRNAREIANSR
jgi:hypothetical protein